MGSQQEAPIQIVSFYVNGSICFAESCYLAYAGAPLLRAEIAFRFQPGKIDVRSTPAREFFCFLSLWARVLHELGPGLYDGSVGRPSGGMRATATYSIHNDSSLAEMANKYDYT